MACHVAEIQFNVTFKAKCIQLIYLKYMFEGFI